jgi:hypothetical protein
MREAENLGGVTNELLHVRVEFDHICINGK